MEQKKAPGGGTQESFSFIIPAEEDGESLGRVLFRRGFSQKLLTRLKNRGGVSLDGEFHRMIDPVGSGQQVTIRWPDAEAASTGLLPAPELAVPVVYEDDHYIIFNKPAGLAIHPCARHYHRSLGNYFAALYPGLPFRPIGRLDKDTTGLCAVAKNGLAAALGNQGIAKTYFAMAEGLWPEEKGSIDLPLIRIPGDTIRREVAGEGLKAVTEYRVLRRQTAGPTASGEPGGALTLLEVRLITGRTHQIRAHFSHLGFPLAGDSLYGGHTRLIARQALHCGRISLPDPAGLSPLRLICPLPPDMQLLFPGFQL